MALRLILLIPAGLVLMAIVVAWVLAKRRPGWKTWKVVLAASAPGPVALSLICALWFAVISMEPPTCTYCDNPGMALFGLLMIGTLGSLTVFAVGALFSWLTVHSLRN